MLGRPLVLPTTTTPDPVEACNASVSASISRIGQREAEAKDKIRALVRSYQERLFEARREQRIKKEKIVE